METSGPDVPRRVGHRLPRLFLAAMLGAIGLPLLFTVLIHFSPAAIHTILASPPLQDNVDPPERPRLDPHMWKRGAFQRDFESWFGSRIEPRGRIVQLTNEIYYALFAKSYMYDRQIVVGRDWYLYELTYLEAYCRHVEHKGRNPAAPLVAKLADLSRDLARRDRWLLFLLTPSKAATMPEFLPAGFCDHAPRPADNRESFIKLLRQAGVSTIDGPELVLAMKNSDPLPPFPRGGTHWSLLAAARVSAAVMQRIEQLSRREIGKLEIEPERWDAPPTDTDADLARLLNLWRPPLDYRTASVRRRCRSMGAGNEARLVAVGGSFLGQVLEPIVACGLFGRVDYYFYYDRSRFQWPPGRRFPVDRAAIDWRAAIDQPTAFLVELNESLIDNTAPHLDRFIEDLDRALR